MKVLKFGGSSVANAKKILEVIKIIQQSSEVKAVICSALGGVTDQLIKAGKLAGEQNSQYHECFTEIKQRHLDIFEELLDDSNQDALYEELNEAFDEISSLLKGIYLLKEFSPRASDYLSSFGERLACFLITHIANAQGLKAEYLDARQVILSNEDFGFAQVDFESSNPKIQAYFQEHSALQIITGFIASTPKGITSTLGRGGSDYTAAIFAAALEAQELEIWTDVDGVMTADPRKVSQAFSIPQLSYEEAMEMSHFGAKVIYGPTMAPVLKEDIPIRIRNTFKPEFEGTLISQESEQPQSKVKGISSIDKIALINIWGGGMVGIAGVSARLFGALAREKINVILISQASSEHSICLAVSPKDAQAAKNTLSQEFSYELKEGSIYRVEVRVDLSIIAVVGNNMHRSSNVATKFFSAMGKNGIQVLAIAQGSSELNISAVIASKDEVKALRALHQVFFLSDMKILHLFVVGVGLIGKAFLRQMKEQQTYLKQEYNLDVRLIGLSNSRKHFINPEGIDLNQWKEKLESSEESADIQDFILQIKEFNLINSIFIDNTASAEVAKCYEQILQDSVSIVTPNKIASSSRQEVYEKLKKTARRHNALYLYETNVGAALPVLSTLKDLRDSGDRVLKIEAVLSGTLSYIFNNFNAQNPFSKVVREAKKLGYTEPDPREDLNGSDVGRKILILARESGYFLEFEDIIIEDFLPPAVMNAPSVADFFTELEKADAEFKTRYEAAQQESKVLRYIARFENGQARVALESVGAEHPFFNLSGSDNILAFTTQRYPERPLVVKGSGAGAEVTAAGVFADLMRVANYL